MEACPMPPRSVARAARDHFPRTSKFERLRGERHDCVYAHACAWRGMAAPTSNAEWSHLGPASPEKE
eukprot:3203558-Alexandrium_andersonii.AAC.1